MPRMAIACRMKRQLGTTIREYDRTAEAQPEWMSIRLIDDSGQSLKKKDGNVALPPVFCGLLTTSFAANPERASENFPPTPELVLRA